MPLVRFEVRNEYRLGQPQLYSETSRGGEDPKAVLDGVAVAGLVGILRQLGDLAEFAGEVFHGLQEQIMSTASRSHKLLVRVQNIEAALPSLEKAVLAQNSHIHFAYTAGSEWRARIRNGQNHFIYNDLPRFIMDSYEECRDPPRLHLLDKFDTGGPGSCLRRYSDPTFFRKAADNFNEPNIEKVPKEKKARKNKKKRSSKRNADFLHSASMPNRSGRMAFSTPIDNGHTSSHTTSTTDIAVKSDMGYHSNSFDSRTGSDYVERVFRSNSTAKPEDRESEEFSSSFMHHNNIADSVLSNEQPSIATDDFPRNSSPEPNAAPGSSCDTWDEKAEIIEPKGLNFDGSEVPEIVTTDCDLETQNDDILNVNNPAQMDLEYDFENMCRASIGRNDLDEVESETDNFMDALNTIESESENELDFHTKHELEQFSAIVDDEQVEDELSKDREVVSEDHTSKLDTHVLPDISLDREIVTDLPDIPSESAVHEHNSPISEEVSDSENLPGIESSKNPDDSKRESLITEPSSSGYTGIGSSTSPEVLGSSKVESIICEPLSSGYTSIGDSASPDALGSSKVESVSSEPSSSGYTGFGDSVTPDALGSSKVEPMITEPSSSGYTGLGDSPSPDALGSSKVESIISEPSSSGYAGTGDSASQDAVSSSKVESIISEPSSSSAFGISNFGEQNTVSNSYNYEKAEISSVYPVSFWTNGGLLGLQPSKPPDFSIPRTAGQDPSASTVEVPGNGGNNPGSMESIPSSQYKGQDAEVDFHQSNRVSNVNGGLGKSSTAKPMPLDMDIEAASTGSSRENDEHSTETIGLGHRLLLNGFRRKLTLVPDGKTKEAKSSALELKIFSETNGFKPSFNSLTSSPPLDHMKISFHPVDGFESSKLNLKFPDSNGIIKDMFPSFQLVPEPGFSVQDVGFDSDDDTFCRSSPDLSDDCVSHRSDSDSEQWESGESPENKDHKLYEEPSLSSSLLDLPSFDAVNPGLQGKQQKNVDQEDFEELQCPEESKPPPPLPPPSVQRRLTKSTSTVEEDKQNIISHLGTADPNLRGSTVYQQPKPATAIYQQVNEEAIAFRLKAKKEANQPTNDKGMDEKDDFLNQIRTKSFTLRRTVTAKANFASGPTANDKVTAILEKANAIRQAVGSDDGEDDSWSDT